MSEENTPTLRYALEPVIAEGLRLWDEDGFVGEVVPLGWRLSEWLADVLAKHLASQPVERAAERNVTDAEVEAAREAFFDKFYRPGYPHHDCMRAALEAARAARGES